jgi:hypothetical protein
MDCTMRRSLPSVGEGGKQLSRGEGVDMDVKGRKVTERRQRSENEYILKLGRAGRQ